MSIVVGISELGVSDRPDDLLVTYSLGSCIGVVIYDPVASVGGLIHCMLPLSRVDPAKAKEKPAMFVDTGIPFLFEQAYRLGGQKKRLMVKVAGCAEFLDEKGIFRIGQRNYTVLRKMLWKNNLLIDAEDVGGNWSRTMLLEVGTGRVIVKSAGREVEL